MNAIHHNHTHQRLTRLYSLSHQELFELAKLMAVKTVMICRNLQGCPAPDHITNERIDEAMEYAASIIPDAVDEAKHNYRPTGWKETSHV